MILVLNGTYIQHPVLHCELHTQSNIVRCAFEHLSSFITALRGDQCTATAG